MSLQSIPEIKHGVFDEAKISEKLGPKNAPNTIAGSPFIRAFGRLHIHSGTLWIRLFPDLL